MLKNILLGKKTKHLYPNSNKEIFFALVATLVVVIGLSVVVAQPYSLGSEMFRIDALGKPFIHKIGNDAAVNTAVQTLQQYPGTYHLVPITSEHELHRTLESAVGHIYLCATEIRLV